ncbi:hypothetical protein BsIDN1_63560 [Bacillus safensis]|uniref:Major facilitator superfamily (MFS) profile domain-containing protein n=1 Tax=Bacillus safensis TaxID=561879 RepID=A0A5S9MI29_BACIA|nr:hypothetical protein BsIDN1_63560 [Bacillus safensis]
MYMKNRNGWLYFFGALGGALYGYDTGVISGAILFMKEDLGLNAFTEGLVVSSILIGAMLGSSLSGKLTDQFGRKKKPSSPQLFCLLSVDLVQLLPRIRK